MRRLLISICLVAGLAMQATAESEDPIASVIGQQIEAFQADDFAGAFAFASPSIRQMFGSADNFGVMVRRGYPMVHRPAEVEFLDQIDRDGATYQTVRILDQNGTSHLLEYMMILGPDGWRINGVRFLRAPAIGA
jgi:hypothetical protein